MELSWIQRHVLHVLVRHESARVKDLTPPDIAANLFAYHLDGLVSAKLIRKSGRGVYELTMEGEKYVGTISTAINAPIENIKTVVLLYARRGDEYLLFRWSRQPYLGKVTPLYDRVPVGKTLAAGIKSALMDKLGGMHDVSYRTSTIVKVMHEDVIISHMNALVYEVSLNESDLLFTSRNGEAFFAGLTESDEVMQGVPEFFAHLDRARAPFDSTWQY